MMGQPEWLVQGPLAQPCSCRKPRMMQKGSVKAKCWIKGGPKYTCTVDSWKLSGFKPGSALSDPGRGQPMSLGALVWSIMSLDGLVHPRKIIRVYLTCPHSH